MGLFSSKVSRVGVDVVERLRRAYLGLGPGLAPEASALFEDDGPDGVWWRLTPRRRERALRASELSSGDLFLLPPAWEVTEVVPRQVAPGRNRITVTGFMRCRPRGGSWEKVQVPFMHTWTVCRGRILRFQNVLEGVELRKGDGTLRCDPA